MARQVQCFGGTCQHLTSVGPDIRFRAGQKRDLSGRRFQVDIHIRLKDWLTACRPERGGLDQRCERQTGQSHHGGTGQLYKLATIDSLHPFSPVSNVLPSDTILDLFATERDVRTSAADRTLFGADRIKRAID